MKKRQIPIVDINDTNSWIRYKPGLCDDCLAYCCRMPVEATVDDLIRMEVITPFEAAERLKKIAKKLKKAGVIDHYTPSRSVFTLARRPNSDCVFLDPQSRRCTIYGKRPAICRNHPEVGPRPGYCPHKRK
ncbi:MAG: YkgJ family cysteine cluster protein [Chloroflexota bacterium]